MHARKGTALDPKGLIAESYKIDGITEAECRTIFLDWAISFDGDTTAAIEGLLEVQSDDGHPMTKVLREGQAGAARPRRRGGWRARPRE